MENLKHELLKHDLQVSESGETSEDVHEADGEDSQASESDAAEPPSGSDSD